MLGVLAIPSLIYTLMVVTVPESPRWLISIKNDLPAAKKVLAKIGVENPDDEVSNIITANAAIETHEAGETIFSSRYRRVLWLAFLVAFFNQLSGINFILYYAPEILSRIGLGATESLANSIAIGGTNLIFTFVGLYLIDRLGRRTLLIIGSLGYIISLSLVAIAFKTEASPAFLMIFLLMFIASHAIGQGAVIWVFIAEIFPNKVRALGQSRRPRSRSRYHFCCDHHSNNARLPGQGDWNIWKESLAYFSFFRFYDGVAAHLGIDQGARNKRSFSRRVRKKIIAINFKNQKSK